MGKGMEVLVVMVSPGSAIIRLMAGFWGELGDLEFSHEAVQR